MASWQTTFPFSLQTHFHCISLQPLVCPIRSTTILHVYKQTRSHISEEDHAAAPLVQSLMRRATDPAFSSFAFPGHSRAVGAPPSLSRLPLYAFDVPATLEVDGLFFPHGAIAKARSKAAALFGAQDTHFLVNGSTCGIQAAIMATCSPGQTLILARNTHKSAAAGMVFSGAIPKYIMPTYDAHWDIAHGICSSSVDRAFVELDAAKVHDVGAVLITSPSYFGVCSDVRKIAQICHSRGVPLIIDEAHGAHFNFHGDFPASALKQGSDIVVQSTHKVLSSLSQSAMLHVQGELVDRHRLSKCLESLQTTSPSVLLLSSLDASREQVSGSRGPALFSKALELAMEARESLMQVAGIEVLDSAQLMKASFPAGVAMDPLRITIGVRGLALSAYKVDYLLSNMQHKIVAEMKTLHSLLFAISLGTRKLDVVRLVQAFEALSESYYTGSTIHNGSSSLFSELSAMAQLLPPASRSMTPTQAFFAASKRVDAEAACGQVCAELVCPMPPGIPLLVPGEIISPEAISYLRQVNRQGGAIVGASDCTAQTFLVCHDNS